MITQKTCDLSNTSSNSPPWKIKDINIKDISKHSPTIYYTHLSIKVQKEKEKNITYIIRKKWQHS